LNRLGKMPRIVRQLARDAVVENAERGGAERTPIPQSAAQLAFEKLGGEKLIGVDVRSEADLIEVLDRGIPLGALSELTKESLSADEVERLIIPRRTLSHRKARNQSLSRAESERALRVASILAQAEQTFANTDKARIWLRRQTSALGGRRPIDLLDCETGGRLVEQLLYRIGHGIAA
jgi:putative toxin-antitoxin system antitoxin component (TIGR02293 family)